MRRLIYDMYYRDEITVEVAEKLLDCSSRTIHRNMCADLKREKELLNKQL